MPSVYPALSCELIHNIYGIIAVKQAEKDKQLILSFKDEETEDVFNGAVCRSLPPDIQNTARRKLRYLDNAAALTDLRSPPGNPLEALKENRQGQYSIRINDQWRICFVWAETDAEQAEITDYH